MSLQFGTFDEICSDQSLVYICKSFYCGPCSPMQLSRFSSPLNALVLCCYTTDETTSTLQTFLINPRRNRMTCTRQSTKEDQLNLYHTGALFRVHMQVFRQLRERDSLKKSSCEVRRALAQTKSLSDLSVSPPLKGAGSNGTSGCSGVQRTERRALAA